VQGIVACTGPHGGVNLSAAHCRADAMTPRRRRVLVRTSTSNVDRRGALARLVSRFRRSRGDNALGNNTTTTVSSSRKRSDRASSRWLPTFGKATSAEASTAQLRQAQRDTVGALAHRSSRKSVQCSCF
jgi:hypothetical protein